MALKIEDYAIIGDCKSAALVGADGSIDWLCWPRFDSAACFAALLGTPENGRWLIAPTLPPLAVSRRYRAGTLVLETEFQTETGCAAIVDFMPLGDGADLVRIVMGRSGRVDFRTEYVARFNYGATVPWTRRLYDGAISAVAGPERLVLRSQVALRGEDLKTVGEFTVDEGQSVAFVLCYGASFQAPPSAIDPFEFTGAHGDVLAGMDRSVSRGRPVDRGRQALAHHAQGFDLRPDGRDRRCGDHFPSRADRGREELGLPLLLVAGRHLHHPGLDETRISR